MAEHDAEVYSSMNNQSASAYLESLLNKTLRIHTTDTRMFVGDFKCTDNECNVILSRAYEYRYPSTRAVNEALAAVAREKEAKAKGKATSQQQGAAKANMTSRFMGLIVVPGKHIVKIEVEE